MSTTDQANASLNYLSSETLDFLLTTYGSDLYLDNFNLYPFTVISVIGFILNILSYIIFSLSEFKNNKLYSYLRVYSINSVIMFFISIFNFVYNTIRIIPWSNSYWAQVYCNYMCR
jgi:hypothetical protein